MDNFGQVFRPTTNVPCRGEFSTRVWAWPRMAKVTNDRKQRNNTMKPHQKRVGTARPPGSVISPRDSSWRCGAPARRASSKRPVARSKCVCAPTTRADNAETQAAAQCSWWRAVLEARVGSATDARFQVNTTATPSSQGKRRTPEPAAQNRTHLPLTLHTPPTTARGDTICRSLHFVIPAF